MYLRIRTALTRAIAGLLYRLGYSVKRNNRDFDAILSELIAEHVQSTGPLVVFDVGAHGGGSIRRFKQAIKRDLQIYSFEPSKYMFAELARAFGDDAACTLENVGVGARRAEMIFNEHLSSNGSSSLVEILPRTPFALRRGIAERTIDRYKVPVVSLDDYCRCRRIDRINLLKIDVQGFEAAAIEGCTELLKHNRIDIIEVEVIVAKAYQRRTTFFDIEKGLVDYGYRMVALSNDGRFYNMGPFDLLQNRELQFDVIYANSQIYDSIF